MNGADDLERTLAMHCPALWLDAIASRLWPEGAARAARNGEGRLERRPTETSARTADLDMQARRMRA